MNKIYILFLFILFQACIGDDIIDDLVEPVIRITNPIDTIQLNTSYQFEFSYFNNIGREETIDAVWSSTDQGIISISPEGVANAKTPGTISISVSYTDGTNQSIDEIVVTVGDHTSGGNQLSGTIQTTSSYTLHGDFTITQEGDDLFLEIGSNWAASSDLPGLYLYLSNNPNSKADALEVAAVTVFSGAHEYTIPETGLNDYSYLLYFCKPFNVKVGHGEIK